MSKLGDLLKERESAMLSLFYSLFYIIPIITLPSIIVAIIGNMLNEKFGTGRGLTLVMVIFVMLISWTAIYKMYYKINKKMVELDEKIKLEKNKND